MTIRRQTRSNNRVVRQTGCICFEWLNSTDQNYAQIEGLYVEIHHNSSINQAKRSWRQTRCQENLNDKDYSQAEAMETQVHTVISTAPVSADRPDDIKTATAQIKQQSAIKHIIWSGYVETRKVQPTHQQLQEPL